MSLMEYLPDMEIISSDMMERVLEAGQDYLPEKYTSADVRNALAGDGARTPGQFAALLSPAARPYLEEMAQSARRETRANFGNSVYLFTPLYLSNYCENHCVYCGFNNKKGTKRARLEPPEIEREMKEIAATGLEEILLLTGESRKADIEYLSEACRIARRFFKLISLEIYPMNTADYAALHDCGADLILTFQETYDPRVYGQMHPVGRKAVFPYRFYTQERAVLGGIRGVGFAALLGLGDFRRDAYTTGMHAWHLQRKYPRAEITFSCPRLRPAGNEFLTVPAPLSEADLLQVVTAYRLFMPFANITISSRESARFRNNIVKIAATKISAGVNVGVGGHAIAQKGGGQFEINDERRVDEIVKMLGKQGMQAVMSEYLYL